MSARLPALRLTAYASVLTLAAGGLAACGGDSSSGSGGTGTTSKAAGPAKELTFELTDTGCTPSTTTVPAGNVKFSVKNPGTTKTDEFELKNADGIIMGERENLAPGLGSDFTLTLQPGKYVLNCTFQNDARDNGALTVTGASTAADAATDDADLSKGVADYLAYVTSESDLLLKDVKQFAAALQAGDTAKAKDLFGPSRVHYESIEPIAESFGDLDPRIDARVNDVSDRSKWTGFHRIEQILFTKDTTKGTAGYAKKLVADVTELHDKVPGLKLQAAQIANGAIGLLDEVSSSKITGEEDRYSHTDLSDFQANFTGAVHAFQALEPALLARHEDALVKQIQTQSADVQKGLDKYKRDDALGFATYSALTDADRKQFAQQIASLAEPLSLVAGKVLTAAR